MSSPSPGEPPYDRDEVGQWPAIEAALLLTTAGFVGGGAIGVAWQRWSAMRWRRRVEAIVVPIVARAHELAAASEPSLPR